MDWGKKDNRRTTATRECRRNGPMPAVFVQVAVANLAITMTLVPIRTLESTELLSVAKSGHVAEPAEWPPSLKPLHKWSQKAGLGPYSMWIYTQFLPSLLCLLFCLLIFAHVCVIPKPCFSSRFALVLPTLLSLCLYSPRLITFPLTSVPCTLMRTFTSLPMIQFHLCCTLPFIFLFP